MRRGLTGRFEAITVADETVRAFIPHPLPPEPPLELTAERQQLLERATLALGRLDSITLLLPDPDLFLYAYVRREAVLSSQIEGTQSSLAQLLLFELEETPGVPVDDVVEVSSYVAALDHGLRRLQGEGNPYPALIKAALAHAQFETMHPFLDGNGRIGRLLIAFVLHHDRLPAQPLLYLSLYCKQHRAEYYRLLDLVRTEGNWEAWLDFFLEGVERTATNAVETAKRLLALFQQDEQRIQRSQRSASTSLRVFRMLCQRPLVSLKQVCQ